MNGIFYGVSVGPGDPELVTVRAVKTLERCGVIAYPQSKGRSTALEIAAGAADLGGKELLPLDFLMTGDKQALDENYRRIAGQLERLLGQGKDVAMPVLGDLSLYSTFCRVAELLEKAGHAVERVAGVCSPCACAAAAGIPLAAAGQQLHVIPASDDITEVFGFSGTRIVMKSGGEMSRLVKLLDAEGMLDKAVFVENCGMENQRILRGKEAVNAVFGYFTTAIIKE